ncbi:MAG: hypothetical protein K9J81_12145 [Desulfohalobiaceae bacterium]|nr:hypothetical protein [Desulfohalobiaceae bacterium]
MSSKATTQDTDPGTDYLLRLYVTGNASNSLIARQNLHNLQEALPAYRFSVEIVDVLQNPETALEHGVYVTPALQILGPNAPGQLIFGNLSNLEAVMGLFSDGAQQ